MGDRDWRPFIYGGLASITAEFGKPDITCNCVLFSYAEFGGDILHSTNIFHHPVINVICYL